MVGFGHEHLTTANLISNIRFPLTHTIPDQEVVVRGWFPFEAPCILHNARCTMRLKLDLIKKILTHLENRPEKGKRIVHYMSALRECLLARRLFF